MKHFFAYLTLCLMVTSCSYLPSSATKDNGYTIEETEDYIALKPLGTASNMGLLFVPGGLVDPHAYISTTESFVNAHNMMVVIPKVRYNLAIMNKPQVQKVRKQFKDRSFYLGGHSLGGAVACMVLETDASDYSGLFLMGAYANKSISNFSKPVLSFMAEFDGLATADDYKKYEENLPAGIIVNDIGGMNLGNTAGTTIYFKIAGGNHAQYGDYGKQKGDGTATISTSQQHEIIFKALTLLMRNNGVDI